MIPLKRLLLVILCCILLTMGVFAADYSVSRIEADCAVSRNGSYTVLQQITLEIPKKVDEITIPVGMDVDGVTVTSANGDVHLSRHGGGTFARIKFDKPFFGELTVSVSYENRGILAEEGSKQLLTCELLCGLWEVAVERFSFIITMPDDITEEPVFTSGYRGQDIADVLVPPPVTQGSAVAGQVRGGLFDRENFSATFTTPKGYFATKSTFAGGVFAWILTGVMLLLAGAGVYYWFTTLRSPRLRVQARTVPPESVSPAELQSLLCGGKPSFGLLVCRWAHLGYLNITVNSAGRILLRKNMDMGSERREEDKKLFDLLFGTSDVCEACGSRWQHAADVAEKALQRYWYRRLYETSTGGVRVLRILAAALCGFAMMISLHAVLPSMGIKWLLLIVAFFAGCALGTAALWGIIRLPVRDLLWVPVGGASFLVMYLMARLGGGFLPMVLALTCVVLAAMATRFGGKLNQSGADLIERTMGFCRFLQHAEDRHLCQMLERDGQYFYSNMLYAHAAGVGKSFARRFGDSRLEACPWLVFSSKTPTRAYPYYLRFEEMLRKMDQR